MLGKTARKISNVWKKAAGFFQASETQTEILPTSGRPSRNYSNLRMESFQTSEDRPRLRAGLGPRAAGCRQRRID